MYVDVDIDYMRLTHTCPPCAHRPPLRVCAKERESVCACTFFSVCVCVREGLEGRDCDVTSRGIGRESLWKETGKGQYVRETVT